MKIEYELLIVLPERLLKIIALSTSLLSDKKRLRKKECVRNEEKRGSKEKQKDESSERKSDGKNDQKGNRKKKKNVCSSKQLWRSVDFLLLSASQSPCVYFLNSLKESRQVTAYSKYIIAFVQVLYRIHFKTLFLPLLVPQFL